jgi:hypothetical protein
MPDASIAVEGAPVYGSGGGCLGYATGLEGGVLLVDCLGVRGARLHVPLEWVVEAGDCVRLCKTCREVRHARPVWPGG